MAIVDVSNPDRDEVVAIPESLIAKTQEIRHAKLPFTVRVKEYFENSRPAGPMVEGKKMQAAGSSDQFSEVPLTATMDEKNVPSVLLELTTESGKVGEWVASLWQNEAHRFEFSGRTYQLLLRPIRYYKPYNITLLDFRHDVYPGTTKPSNFSSKIHLSDPTRAEERDVLIRMNEPLRYAGETYFQASFDPTNDKVTILQVVRNPAAITPYVSCILMGLGLLVQFLMHLIGFAQKRKNQIAPQRDDPRKTTSTALAAGERNP